MDDKLSGNDGSEAAARQKEEVSRPLQPGTDRPDAVEKSPAGELNPRGESPADRTLIEQERSPFARAAFIFLLLVGLAAGVGFVVYLSLI